MIKSLKITPNKILTEFPRLNRIAPADFYDVLPKENIKLVPELSDIQFGNHKFKTFFLKTRDLDVFLVCTDDSINRVIGIFEFKISMRERYRFGGDLNIYSVNLAEIHKDFIGKGIGTFIYDYIVNGLGYILISGESQSLRANYLWKKLMSSNKYDVYIIDPYYESADANAKYFYRVYRAKDVLDSDYFFNDGEKTRNLFKSDVVIALAKKSSPSSLKLNKLAKEGTLL